MFIACLEAGADFGGIVMSFENMPDSTDMEISAQSTTVENTPGTSPIAPMAANGHICTDPDEHGPQGNGNGYGHDKGTTETQLTDLEPPSDTKPYGGTIKKKLTSTIKIDIDEWIPEDLDSAKHTTENYESEPYDPNGICIKAHLENKNAYNDGYLDSVVKLLQPITRCI